MIVLLCVSGMLFAGAVGSVVGYLVGADRDVYSEGLKRGYAMGRRDGYMGARSDYKGF